MSMLVFAKMLYSRARISDHSVKEDGWSDRDNWEWEAWLPRWWQPREVVLRINFNYSFSDFFPDTAPQISPASNDVSAVLWSPAWLKCQAIYPAILTAPETFWVFNNTRIPKESQHYQSKEYGPTREPNSTTKFISFELRISNVSAQDVGWYTCGLDFKIDVVKANIFFSLRPESPGGKFVSGNFYFVFFDFIL